MMVASGTAQPVSLRAYSLLTRCLSPLVGPHLRRRAARGKEDAHRLEERYGRASIERPAGRLVWLHAASVGETISILPLVNKIAAIDGTSVLVTSGTVTSATLMKRRLPKSAFHQYAPLDHPSYVKRFIEHWQPDVAVWVESELWPNLLHQTSGAGIPCVLLNARMSEKSARGWSRFPELSSHLLSRFSACLAQDGASADRLISIGARNVEVMGNLKLASPALPFDDAERARLEAEIEGRPVWVAASTHPGEDEVVLKAHRRILENIPDVLTIIVPRHPERGDDIATLISQNSFSFSRRSQQNPIDLGKSIYLADTLGELGLIYAISKVAFVGGSFVPHGGQNPLEPARSDCIVLVGPYTDNFAAVVKEMTEYEAIGVVSDADSLAQRIVYFLEREPERQEQAHRALKVATASNKVQETAYNTIVSYLNAVGQSGKEGI